MSDTPYTIAAPATVYASTPAKPEPVKAWAIVGVNGGQILDIALAGTPQIRMIMQIQKDDPDQFRIVTGTFTPDGE